jgi:hypothetical protein
MFVFIHPDKNRKEQTLATALGIRLNAAYETIKNHYCLG